jgi:hypothetical protein
VDAFTCFGKGSGGLAFVSLVSAEAPGTDTYEPASFKWNESRYRARKAAKDYSEQTHADY